MIGGNIFETPNDQIRANFIDTSVGCGNSTRLKEDKVLFGLSIRWSPVQYLAKSRLVATNLDQIIDPLLAEPSLPVIGRLLMQC